MVSNKAEINKVVLSFDDSYNDSPVNFKNWLVDHCKVECDSVLEINQYENNCKWQLDVTWTKEFTNEMFKKYFHYMLDGSDQDNCLLDVTHNGELVNYWM
jgi:hypothetical protein